MSVTLQDIAEEARVSRTMVARVLNGTYRKVGIREDSAQRIMQIARRMGYRPNLAARGIAKGSFHNIVFLQGLKRHTSDLTDELLGAVGDRLAEAGFHLTLSRLSDELLTDDNYVPQFLRTWMCDGVLMNYHAGAPGQLTDLIDKAKLPVIWVNAKLPADCVYPDDLGAGAAAAERLYDAGHRRIAIVDSFYLHASQTDVLHYSKRDRLDGALNFLRGKGIEPELVLANAADPEHDMFRQACQTLRRPDRPTGVIGYSMWEATCVQYAAVRSGLRIPTDLSIIVHGDAPNWIPERKLSMFLTPQEAMGKVAAELVLAKIGAPHRQLKPRVLRCAWEEGQTLAPPAKVQA